MSPEEKILLAKEITQMIIDKLNVTHVTADEVKSDTPLFSKDNELGLDSIDAIEIVMALQQEYGVRITDQQPARDILTSIDSIVEFLIAENATKKII